MEWVVEKIGMSRTISVPSFPVTLLQVIDTKICEVRPDGKALVAFSQSKKMNKAIEGQQKKYSLPKEFNKFMTIGGWEQKAKRLAGTFITVKVGSPSLTRFLGPFSLVHTDHSSPRKLTGYGRVFPGAGTGHEEHHNIPSWGWVPILKAPLGHIHEFLGYRRTIRGPKYGT